MTVQELQREFLPTLAPEDFFILLAHATGEEKTFLLAHPEYELSAEKEEKAREYLKRRLKYEPVASITGHKEFYGRDFLVTEATLIPRPETELLIERALALFETDPPLSQADIIDLGTGSGNIIITLAKELPKKQRKFFGIDVSEQALAIARKNAERLGAEKDILFLHSDLLRDFPLPQEKNRHLVIAANLPYLSSEIYQASSEDVRNFEPKSALESGADGLDHYRRLFDELEPFRKHFLSAALFLEISPEQSSILRKIILQAFPEAEVSVLQDLADKDRLIQAIL